MYRNLEIYLELNNSSINYGLKSSITCKADPYTGGNRKSGLCLTGKLDVMKEDPESLFNTHQEFVPRCRHMNKFTLSFSKKK